MLVGTRRVSTSPSSWAGISSGEPLKIVEKLSCVEMPVAQVATMTSGVRKGQTETEAEETDLPGTKPPASADELVATAHVLHRREQ